MLSLSLGDSRIFFVWEMKFPYKKSISESENVEDSN